ncbi:flagellar biosynthesis protein FlhB [soil metagenome]
MAEEADQDSKTEEATPRKIEESVGKGNTPFSREAPVFASLVGILAVTAFMLHDSAVRLMTLLERLLETAGDRPIESDRAGLQLMMTTVLDASAAVFPLIAVLMVAGFVASAVQNPVSFVLDRIKPEASRISLGKGWSRTFGSQGFVEFLKASFKFGAVGTVAFLTLRAQQDQIVNAMLAEPATLPDHLTSIAVRLLGAAAVATVLLMAADVVWSRVHWRNKLRMTRQELKDEHKQSDGDPIVKARQRSLARDRQRNRMIAAVPKASFVVANPTHYAVALHYTREKGGAPVVVAKGKDLIALKIRQIAEEHGIPVIEDKPLARALCKSVEVNTMIPAEFYQAVAQIIYFINSHKNVYSPAR